MVRRALGLALFALLASGCPKWTAPPASGRRSRSVTEVSPNVSRNRASSDGSADSPRSTCPASADRISALALAWAACRVLRAARSTMAATAAATRTKTTRANRFSGLLIVNSYRGGVKK